MRWLTLVLAVALASCSKGGSEGGAGGPGGRGGRGGPGGPGGMQFPVEVAPVAVKPVQYAVTAVGSVEAFEQVQVTARVAGVVEKVAFAEGDQVQKGQSLVEIEPSRWQLQVKVAEANLQKAKAAGSEAQAALARREAVEKANPGLIPGEQLESFRTRALSAAADVGAAQSALEQAQLNLRDAYVKAPIAGVIQTRTVQTGQYVQPGTVLATLVRREPMLLRFGVPEADAVRVKVGQLAKFKVKNVPGELEAKIAHVAESADPASRMVAVTAEVQGEGKELARPGSFADVSVPVGGGARQSPVIPQTAVRPSEKGFLVYVVENGKAKEKVVELGLRTEGGLVEVRRGVEPGMKLVVRGAEALRDGVPVKEVAATEELPSEGPASAPPRLEGEQRPEGSGGAGGSR